MHVSLQRGSQDRSSERGVVALYVAIGALLFFGVGAFAVDVARWYVEGARLQKTVDLAALSGVVALPSDPTDAQSLARTTSVANGWTIDDNLVTFQAQQLANPTRLQVTMSSQVDNTLARLFGVPTTRITKTAVADFAPPATLGSPCNVLGRQDMDPDVVGDCGDNQNYWLNVAGPESTKRNGDNFAASWCNDDSTDGCRRGVRQAPANVDYNDFPGYVYIVEAGRSGTLRLEGYDLGFYETGDFCNRPMPSVPAGLASDPDYQDRFVRGNSTSADPFCSGDVRFGPDNSGSGDAVDTQFSILEPSPSVYRPLDGELFCQGNYEGVLNGDIAAQFDPEDGDPATDNGINTELEKHFHRWSQICDRTGPQAESDADDNATLIPVQAGERWAIRVQTSDGGGHNRYALRASIDGSSDVRIYAIDRFSIYTNTATNAAAGGNSPATFNLIRLDSSTAGKTVRIGLFDLGDVPDGTITGTMRDPSGDPFDQCRATIGQPVINPLTGQVDTNYPDYLSGWEFPGRDLGGTCGFNTAVAPGQQNGRLRAFTAAIPSDYTCNDSDLTACWVTVELDPTVAANDTTTWSAEIIGDPVRLVDSQPG